jgi:biotin synthase
MLRTLADKVLSRESLTKDEALSLVEGTDAEELFSLATDIREKFRPPTVDLCSIVSAKTGACPEDCSYCAQSKISVAEIEKHRLVAQDYVVERARAAKEFGARRFCIVTSGKGPTARELDDIARMISGVKAAGLLPCATLGILDEGAVRKLKEAGLHRYHHNLETSRRFFPEVCRSHTYEDKLRTIEAVKNVGLSLCSGGIFGLGEEWEDRVDMALELRRLGADSIPINFLVPIKGTPLGDTEPLPPIEALKIISLYRFLLPDKEIRVCGGRVQTLGEYNSRVIEAGADGLLTGDCLTVSGRSAGDDLRLIRDMGLEVATDQ